MYTLLLLLLVSIISGLILYFYKKNKKIKQKHFHDIHTLQQTISLHKTQISYREKGLEQYRFLKYNLEESLVMQPKINLN